MSAPITACHCGDTANCNTCYQREYKRRVYRLQAYGQWEPKGDLEAVRAHIAWLRQNRVGYRSIHLATGISPSTLGNIARGRNKWVSKSVADRILAVDTDGGVRVLAYRVARRLQALNAIGHSTYWMADQLGTYQNNVVEMMCRNNYAARATFEKVDALFCAYSMTPGTSQRSREAAERNGYAPPLAWTDIDDPDEEPYRATVRDAYRSNDDVDEVVVMRLLAGARIPSTRAEKDEAMRRWKRAGRAEAELCRIQGWKDARYGREDAA